MGDPAGQRRLAGAGEAADGDEPGCRRREIGPGPVEIGARLLALGLGLGRVALHGRRGRRDLGPDRRAHGQIERQHPLVGVVVHRLQIAVAHQRGRGGQPAVIEIHQEEGDVVEWVDLREGVVELHRVEQGGRTLDLADVAQMQVPVTVAHPRAAPGERRRPVGQRGLGARAKRLHGRRVEAFLGRDVGEIVARDRGRRGWPVDARHRLGDAVEARDLPRQCDQRGIRQAPLGRLAVEQRVGVEPPHDDDPVDGVGRPLAALAQAQVVCRRLRRRGDRRHAQIERGRGAPVERHLRLGAVAPGLGRAVVHEGKAHRALQLVDIGAGQEDHARMGVDARDLGVRRQPVGRRIGQQRDLRVLVLDDEIRGHARVPFPSARPGGALFGPPRARDQSSWALTPASAKVAMPAWQATADLTKPSATAAPEASPRRMFRSKSASLSSRSSSRW